MTAHFSRHLISEVLAEYGALVRNHLPRYLPMGEPRRHLYDPMRVYPQRGGKMMRPSLCLATARAFGGSLDEALHSAIAVEMLHNAMLIHDDIEDASEERRGEPTLHQLIGIPLALNAGDMLTLLSLRPLIENADRLGLRLTHRLIDETQMMAAESAEGQAVELGWIRDNVFDVGTADYLEMVLKKTCWLATIYPMRSGALIATRGQAELEPFLRFGFFLGAAFQIQDDLLNLVGNRESYGKELAGDLWEGKRTLMLLRLYELSSDADRRRIEGIMERPREERREGDVRWLWSRMRRTDCLDYARQIAHGLAGAAHYEFQQIFGPLPPSRDKGFLEQLIGWTLERHV